MPRYERARIRGHEPRRWFTSDWNEVRSLWCLVCDVVVVLFGGDLRDHLIGHHKDLLAPGDHGRLIIQSSDHYVDGGLFKLNYETWH